MYAFPQKRTPNENTNRLLRPIAARAIDENHNSKQDSASNHSVLFRRVAVISVVLILSLLITIGPPSARSEATGRELYNVTSRSVTDQIQDLPRNYGEIEQTETLMPPVDLSAIVETVEKADEAQLTYGPVSSLKARRFSPASAPTSEANQSALFFSTSNKAGGAPERIIATALASSNSPGQIGSETITAGTLIPASLITGINSDLPGPVIAQVTQNVYDSATGEHVLIPQGARIIGAYDSGIDFGQRRVFISWRRIVNPDGSSVLLDNLGAADLAGYSGLSDRVDNHTGKLVRAGVLSTLLGVGAELAVDNDDGDVARALREGLQGTANHAGQQLLRRQLNIKPTLTVRPGWAFQIIVTQDLSLSPYGK